MIEATKTSDPRSKRYEESSSRSSAIVVGVVTTCVVLFSKQQQASVCFDSRVEISQALGGRLHDTVAVGAITVIDSR